VLCCLGTSSIDPEKLALQLGKCMEEVTSRRRKTPSSQHRVDKKCISRDYMLVKNSSINLHLQLMFFLYAEMVSESCLIEYSEFASESALSPFYILRQRKTSVVFKLPVKRF